MRELSSKALLVSDLMKELKIHELPQEHIYAVAVTEDNTISCILDVSCRLEDVVSVPPKDLFKKLLVCDISRFYLVRNRNEAKYYIEDLKSVKRIKELGMDLGVLLLDNIILGQNGEYCSFREINMM